MFRVVYNQNLKSKVKVENFHIFLTASGEGGGATQAVSLTASFPFFFMTSLREGVKKKTRKKRSGLPPPPKQLLRDAIASQKKKHDHHLHSQPCVPGGRLRLARSSDEMQLQRVKLVKLCATN